MKKIILLIVSSFTCVVLFVLSFSFLLGSSSYKEPQLTRITKDTYSITTIPKQNIPAVLGAFRSKITKTDARPELLKKFFIEHNSPLVSHAQAIIDASDANEIDYRLITSIAMCESNLGKYIPPGSYNAWGYAVYTGQDSGAVFDDWEDGIKVMARYLAENYYHKGLTTPEEIGPIYAPPSVETGNSWAKCVRIFMNELK